MNNERKLQIIDLMVSIVLFVIACVIGKIVLNIHNTWWAFNGPAIGIVGIGELIWWRIRKTIIKKYNHNKGV